MGLRPKVVIIDLRSVNTTYLSSLKATGIIVVVVDEWGDKEIVGDILINGTPVTAWHRYATDGSVACFVGLKYALLDPSFARAHLSNRKIRDVASNILITLGGDDPFYLTAKVMEALEKISNPLHVTAVIGPAFLDWDTIYKGAAASRHHYTVLRNVRNMAELMLGADLAVTGGGLTCLEAACTGTPTIVVCEVEHQMETARALEDAGAVRSIGLGTEAAHDTIAEHVEALLADAACRVKLSHSGKALVDGRGVERITRILTDALYGRQLSAIGSE